MYDSIAMCLAFVALIASHISLPTPCSSWKFFQIEDIASVQRESSRVCVLEMEAEHSDGDADSDSDSDAEPSLPRLLFRTEEALDHFIQELSKSYQDIYQVALPVSGGEES